MVGNLTWLIPILILPRMNRRTEPYSRRMKYADEINIFPINMRMNSVIRNSDAKCDMHTFVSDISKDTLQR